jgi:hypothetical protein
MTHLVEETRREADAAIAAMRDAAVKARTLHARAELMRHMVMTAGPVKDRPRDEAVRHTVDHWLAAWALTRTQAPELEAMEAFAGAFHDYLRAPTDETDRALRVSAEALERAAAASGTNLVDQMAFWSICAHEWWGEVKPPPQGAGRTDRDWPSEPFWERGCPPQCL